VTASPMGPVKDSDLLKSVRDNNKAKFQVILKILEFNTNF